MEARQSDAKAVKSRKQSDELSRKILLTNVTSDLYQSGPQ